MPYAPIKPLRIQYGLRNNYKRIKSIRDRVKELQTTNFEKEQDKIIKGS